MSVLTTKTARSIIYLGCIGGLLVINSAVVTVTWNSIVAEDQQERRLSFLEGAGITAFAYVVVSAVRYSRQPKSDFLQSLRFRHNKSFIQGPDTSREQLRSKCSKLSQEQRDALKRELEEHCGCNTTVSATPSEKINA